MLAYLAMPCNLVSTNKHSQLLNKHVKNLTLVHQEVNCGHPQRPPQKAPGVRPMGCSLKRKKRGRKELWINFLS